jgi:hypothetical protein
MVAQSPPSDRRRWVRYPADIKTVFQSIIPREEEYHSARIKDVSRGGVRLEYDRPLPAGSLLKIIINDPVKARLVHSTPLPNGKWALGCSLAMELGQAELLELLESGKDEA